MIQSVDLASLKMGSLFRTIFPLLFQWCGGGECVISLVESDEIEEDEVTRATANLETKLNCMLRCKNVETTPYIVRNRKHWHVEASLYAHLLRMESREVLFLEYRHGLSILSLALDGWVRFWVKPSDTLRVCQVSCWRGD